LAAVGLRSRQDRAALMSSFTTRCRTPSRRGEIDKLKAEYRRAVARDGYALVKCELAVFKPEP